MVPFSQLGPECPLQPLPSNGNNPSAPYILQGTTGNGRTTTVSQDEGDSSEDDSTTWYERLRDARKHDEATKLEDISGAPDHARNTLDASSYRDEHEKNLRGTSQQDQTSSSAASVEAGQVEEVLEVGCTNSLPGEPQTSSCALDEIWVQLETEAGQTYYWNRLDDSTSLELPAGVHAKWIQQRLQDGRSYYWTRDGESTWHLRSLANTHDKASMNSGVLASGIPRDVDGEVTAARQSSCCSAEAGAVVAEKLQEDAKELSEICHVETHNIEVEDIISKHLRARSAWEQRVPCQDVVDVPILEVTETMPLDDPAMPHHEPRIGEVGVTNSVAAEDQSFDTAVAELTELLTSVDALTSSSKAAAEKKAAEENAVAEAARKAAEEKAAAEKEAATERAAEEKAAAEKKAAEEKAMVEAAKKAAAEKKAAEDKAAAEKKAAADKAAAEAAKKAAERAAAEKKAAEDKAAAEKKAAEEKAAAEAAKKAAEKVAAEKKAAEEKASAEKKAAEKRAAEKAAAEASAEKEEALKLRIELAMLRGELEAQTKLLEAKAKRGYKEVLVSERLHIGQEPALTVKEDEKETLALPDQSKDVSRGQIDSSNSFKSHSRDAVECKADPTKQVEIGKSHKKRKGGDPNLQLAKNHTVNTLAPSGGIAPHETKDEGGRRSEPVAAAKEVRSDASHCSSRSSDTHPIQQGCSGKSHAAGDVKLNVLDANDELRRDLEDFEKELPALKRRRGSNPQPAQTIVPTGPELHQEKLDPWQQLSDAVLKKKKPRQERSHVEELPKRKKSEEADEKSGKESTPLKKELPKRKKPEEADEKSEKDERVTKLKEVDDQVRHSKVKRVKQGGIAVNVLRELSSARRVQSVSITTDAREDVGTIDKENCRMSNESLEQEHVMVRSRAESCKLKRGSSPQTLSSKTLMSDNSLPHGRSDEQSQPRATRDTNSSRRETKAILKAREASPRTSCAARGKEADDCLLGKFLASVRFGVPPGNWGNDTAVKAVAPNSLPDSCPWANRLGA